MDFSLFFTPPEYWGGEPKIKKKCTLNIGRTNWVGIMAKICWWPASNVLVLIKLWNLISWPCSKYPVCYRCGLLKNTVFFTLQDSEDHKKSTLFGLVWHTGIASQIACKAQTFMFIIHTFHTRIVKVNKSFSYADRKRVIKVKRSPENGHK